MRKLIEEYPFSGLFYRTFIDDSKPLIEQVEEKLELLKTKCDIQQVSQSDGGNFFNASFKIYIPINTNSKLKVQRGDLFEGDMYGMAVNGEIIGIYASQLSGCTIYIKDRDV